jgi:Ribbon-helix-helix protein, copG family
MHRTTIMAHDETVERLKGLARQRGVSFAEVVREALDEKAASYRPKPTSLGAGQSSPSRTASRVGSRRQPPRSWR